MYDTTDVALYPSAATKLCAAIIARTDIASINTRNVSYTYHISGLLKTIDGPRIDVQDITTFAYYANGNVQTITNALQQKTSLQNYDAHGRPQRIIDANGSPCDRILVVMLYF